MAPTADVNHINKPRRSSLVGLLILTVAYSEIYNPIIVKMSTSQS
jgi:hypothetical protein